MGSGVGGWLLGVVFDHGGWTIMTLATAVPILVAAALAIPGALRRRTARAPEEPIPAITDLPE